MYTVIDTDNRATALRLALPAAVVDAIHGAPKGSYQEGLVAGREAWSGAGLRGAARAWGGAYARSRAHLAERIDAALGELAEDAYGWTASTQLVLLPGSRRRWSRRLVLRHVVLGIRVVWG